MKGVRMSPEKKYDVVAVGAITVDMQMEAADELLAKHGIEKSLSNVVTLERLEALVENAFLLKSAGGPGSNVVTGIASRGGSAALIGKIGNDPHGQFFHERMELHGVSYTPLLPANEDTPTTSILVLMTPDRERTFAALLGAGVELCPEDIDHSLISQAKVVYLDSYLWLSDTGREAIFHAAETASRHGAIVAIALNDARIVAQNREALLALAQAHGDILLGDRREFMALFGALTLEDAFEAVKGLGCLASVTAGAKGAYACENGLVLHIPPQTVEKIVDTNGAGDQYAAGFLYGIARGMSAAESGAIGAAWAAEIIQKVGAEPEIRKIDSQRPFNPPRL